MDASPRIRVARPRHRSSIDAFAASSSERFIRLIRLKRSIAGTTHGGTTRRCRGRDSDAAMPVGDERGAIKAERVAIRAVARVAYDCFASAFIA